MFNAKKSQENSRLGRLLVNRGWITSSELEQALLFQNRRSLRLGDALIQLGLINQKQLDRVLRRQRWIRSLLAGIVMVTSPVNPAFAGEKNITFQYTANRESNWQSSMYSSDSQAYKVIVNNLDVANLEPEKTNNYTLGFKYQFSFNSGIKVGLESAIYNENLSGSKRFKPQFSIFISEETSNISRPDHIPNLNSNRAPRFDRYKNTIPAIYRLTVKGYSLYEQSEDNAQAWGFNRIKNHMCNDYELMFSVTKYFD